MDTTAQSGRLHFDIPQSKFHRLPGAGHMVHQTATDTLMSAINEVAAEMADAGQNLERGAGQRRLLTAKAASLPHGQASH